MILLCSARVVKVGDQVKHLKSNNFFKAEDGIRDLTVTGVQTCALPIYPSRPPARRPRGFRGPHGVPPPPLGAGGAPPGRLPPTAYRITLSHLPWAGGGE